MEMETCRCKCHPVREVCRVCCVRTAKDESFDLMMKQNQTALDLQEKLKQSDLQNQELQKKLEGFRPCGHQQVSEECQACRHDAAVEEICRLKTEIEILKRDPCTERAIVAEQLLRDCANALGLALTHGHPPSDPELRTKFESGWTIYRKLSEQGLFIEQRNHDSEKCSLIIGHDGACRPYPEKRNDEACQKIHAWGACLRPKGHPGICATV